MNPDPCPFCKSEDIAVNVSIGDGDAEEYRYIECHACGAQGPFVQGESEAIKRWNERG